MLSYAPSLGPVPRDYLQSVDLALTLTILLRDEGSVRIQPVARRLGVAESTVHRSLAMLVYRGFATRSEARTYLPGPALTAGLSQPGLGARLISAVRTHIDALAVDCGQTCNLQILTGTVTRVVYSPAGKHPEAVSSRLGQIMPATRNSGGLCILAELSLRELRALYPSLPDAEFRALRRSLHRYRCHGAALAHALFEPGVSAVGMALKNEVGDVLGALSVSVRSQRFRSIHRKVSEQLRATVRRIQPVLAHLEPSEAGTPADSVQRKSIGRTALSGATSS